MVVRSPVWCVRARRIHAAKSVSNWLSGLNGWRIVKIELGSHREL